MRAVSVIARQFILHDPCDAEHLSLRAGPQHAQMALAGCMCTPEREDPQYKPDL